MAQQMDEDIDMEGVVPNHQDYVQMDNDPNVHGNNQGEATTGDMDSKSHEMLPQQLNQPN